MLIRIPATWSGTSAPTEIAFRTTGVGSVSERDVFILASTGNASLEVANATLAFPNSGDVNRGTLQGAGVTGIGDIAFDSTSVLGGAAFIPNSDNSFDNGLTTRRWRHAWAVTGHFNTVLPTTGSVITIAGLTPNTDGADDVGQSTSDRFQVGYFEFLSLGSPSGTSSPAIGHIDFFHSSEANLARIQADNTTGNEGLSVTDDFFPTSDNTTDLGLSNRRWNDIYGSLGHMTQLNLGSAPCAIATTGLVPGGACNTCDVLLRTIGGAGSTLYVCEAGAWAAK
jgi:hypothetical protein